jgi:hypothetical protein
MYFKSYFTINENFAFQGKIKPLHRRRKQKMFIAVPQLVLKNGNFKIRPGILTDEGAEIGTSRYYYESEKIPKEVMKTAKPLPEFFAVEYNEDGSRNKIFEEFSDNRK